MVSLALACAVWLPVFSAKAQVVPSVLEEFRLVTEDEGSAVFLLRFSPAEPRVATIERDPSRPELVMATTLKTGRVPQRQTFRGIVRSLVFSTQGSSLVLAFDTALPATIEAQNMGNSSIWVTGTPERIERVKRQIELIDIPADSVILETQFVELTETGARNLGVGFTNQNGNIAVGTATTGGNNPFGVDPMDILFSGQLQAALNLQIQKGEGRMYRAPGSRRRAARLPRSSPGDALPILTSIQLSGVNGVSQQVQYVNVGVTLQIAPRVSSDGYITSKIYGVMSSVTGFSQGYPTISQREAETSATARDGKTFVIDGLTQENVLTTKSKIPLLGDIPLIGAAFRNERSTSTKTDLFIVITPRIVRYRRFSRDDSEEAGTEPELPAL